MSRHYEVIPAKQWRNVLTGATASVYGAVPYVNENDKLAWTIEECGWTLRNPITGQVGIGRKPFVTFNDACQHAIKMPRPSSTAIGD